MKSSDEMMSVKDILKSKEFKIETNHHFDFLIRQSLRDAERAGKNPRRETQQAKKKIADSRA